MKTAEAIERYAEANLFDRAGLMMSGIDSHTHQPFERDFITPIKVPRRAQFDPWSYWTYEDSVMSMGLYVDGLVLKYQATGEQACLDRAQQIVETIMKVYSCSQVHGKGTFLRPYGGFETMHQFMEPLGTDQSSPLFSGLYRYLPHASDAEARELRRMMLRSLEWYEQQDFSYFYYKSLIHRSTPGDPIANHTNSYYFPAIAWAAHQDQDAARWQEHLEAWLERFRTGAYPVYPKGSFQPTFCWGSDLPILKDILGDRFDELFTEEKLDQAFSHAREILTRYDEPGVVRRLCPESAEPGFQPSIADKSTWGVLGFAYSHTRHQGRTRPRHEIDFLLALAAIGYRSEETAGLAAELMAHRKAVPRDFTAFLSEDYEKLPETVHLYARSVGVSMLGWWRNVWLLANVMKGTTAAMTASPCL